MSGVSGQNREHVKLETAGLRIGRSLRIDEAAFEVEDVPLIHVGLGKGKEGGALGRVEKSLPLSHARERDQKADAVTARPALAAAVGAKLQGSDLRNNRSSSRSSRAGTRIARSERQDRMR